ncbi:MAG: cysteine desulfurase [Oscillospiraceae bacterium]|nr:cysteine desulfurase [Oscillospiraceae bacterium]MBQ6214208.1 cysteine desulfurase [Oscillospiraceae bacterium]
MEHYLDNSATTRVCDEAAEAALNAMQNIYGNPSSTHTKGREAKKLLDSSRKEIAHALGCAADELIFTSCGSESDNTAIIRGAESRQRTGKHIISSSVEHDAVRRSLGLMEEKGFEVTYLTPDSKGAIRAEDVASVLRDDTVLVSLMLVNNETGAVTDIKAVSDVLKAAGSKALLHTDAVQAFLKIPFSADKLGADMISISGHKVHAPKGIGALYIRKGLKLKPFILGGSQEYGLRAGTEAMPQIAAFAAAVKVAYPKMSEYTNRMRTLKEELKDRIESAIPWAVFIGGDAPHILSLSLPGFRSEVLMNYLEARDIYVSKSSACKKGGRSHVLESIGLDSRIIDGALRVGLSRFTSEADTEAFADAVIEASASLAHR